MSGAKHCEICHVFPTDHVFVKDLEKGINVINLRELMVFVQ